MSNDLGNFINKKLNDTYKRLIFDMGPLKPPGPFPKDPHQGNMSFSESYIFQTKYGPVNRFWLCHYPLLDATCCQPCWLFSLQRSTWCTGLRDWKHLSERIKEHGFSKNHIEACAVYEMWQKNINIDKDLKNQIRKKASFWRMVLQRLFDIIIILATNSLALKGHWENLSLEGYHGNFLSVVQLVSRYDQVLNQVLEMPKGSTRYLSPTVQNEMIECIGNTLEGHLLENIRASPFFAIIMDTTQDIAKVDQLSIVVRYAAISRSENGQPVDLKVKEVFLGFYAITKHSAVDLVKQFLNVYHLTFPELTEMCNVYQLCKDIITKFGVMEYDITEVFMEILLFYTIPVTSAGAERSFSRLKIIKNYLRNSTGQDRLKYLSLIVVENKAASKLDLSEVIDQFANIKARKRL
ncbi:hypothetical protein QTP88_024575 [Uroleucon formosanum]